MLDCLFSQLETTGTLCDFQQQPRQARHPWDWEELYRDPKLAIGLLRIYRLDPIPLHDHPGTTGLQITLSDRLQCEQFNLLGKQNGTAGNLTLQRAYDRTLKPGSVISIFTPESGAIHALQSHTEQSIQCCLLFDPYRESERRWFFPLYRTQRQTAHLEVSSFQRPLTREVTRHEASILKD